MDESTLSEIAQLLTGSIGPSTRNATCTALAAYSNGEEGAPLRKLLGTTVVGETIIRRLLLLCGDPGCARLALSALVNISEDESASSTMTRAGAVQRATSALLDNEQRTLASLHSGLLSNLTRYSFGVDALVGKGLGESAAAEAVNNLFKLITIIDRIPNVLWMSNACSTAEGRATLLVRRTGDGAGNGIDVTKQPLTWLLKMLSSQNEAVRLAASSALRNCCMAEDCHEILVNETNAIGMCLSKLMSRERPVPADKLSNAPLEVREIALEPSKAATEPLIEIRQMLVDSLLLLCKTQTGRDALRKCAAYEVLDEWSELEEDEHIKKAVESILDRLAAIEQSQEEQPQQRTPQLPATTA